MIVNNVLWNFSWKKIFLQISGYTEELAEKLVGKMLPGGKVSYFREKYPRPSVQELIRTLSFKNTTSFIIARNPYERLVSSYLWFSKRISKSNFCVFHFFRVSYEDFFTRSFCLNSVKQKKIFQMNESQVHIYSKKILGKNV